MNRRKSLFLLVVCSSLFAAPCRYEDYTPKPSLERLIALRNHQYDDPPDSASEHELQEHARDLFAGVTKRAPCGLPAFLTWFPVPRLPGSAGATALSGRRPLRFERTRVLSDVELAEAETTGPIYTTVLVNRHAYMHIRRRRLVNAQAYLQRTGRGLREVDDFPAGTVTVKATWRVVKQGTSLKVGTWRPEYAQGRHAFPETDWPSYVFVDSTSAPNPAFACVPASGLQQAGHIGPAYFFSLPVTEDMKFEVHSAQGGPPVKGDWLILVALHIATKEIPDWVWMTAWWTDQPSASAGIRQPPWCNYAMGITVSMERPRRPGEMPEFKVLFNPYLEAAINTGAGGLYSNCMTCHSAAGYCHPHPSPNNTGESITLDVLERILRTDFVWTVGRRLGDANTNCLAPPADPRPPTVKNELLRQPRP
jgi:hypothetical protein